MNILYNKTQILQRERVFGLGWNGPGSETTLKEHLLEMKLRPGYFVLDVGCGTGGAAFYLARCCGVHVHGVDISADSIRVANERLAKEDKEIKDKIRFEVGDASQMDYKSNSYDVVYSLKTIFHVQEKELLFKKLYKCLKPGGTLHIIDICLGGKDLYPKELQDYHKEKIYHNMLTKEDNKKLIDGAGFKNIEAKDKTEEINQYCERDLKNFEPTREAFIKDFSKEDYDYIVNFWTSRIERNRAGETIIIYFQGRK